MDPNVLQLHKWNTWIAKPPFTKPPFVNSRWSRTNGSMGQMLGSTLLCMFENSYCIIINLIIFMIIIIIWGGSAFWLRTNGVNTNGAAAEVMDFDRLGKKARPGTSGKIKADYRKYPTSPSVKQHEIRSDPFRAVPTCPLGVRCALYIYIHLYNLSLSIYLSIYLSLSVSLNIYV